MRAAVLEAPRSPLLIRDDVVIDEPHVGEVLVRVSHCGVCHSDLSLVDGTLPAMTPVVLGHEAAGVVEALGPGVTTLAVGDHVVLTPCPPCGHCYWCLRGEFSTCVNSQALMTSTHPDGGTRLRRGDQTVYRGLAVAAFAEHVVIQENGAVKIDPEVGLDVACVIGCAVQTGVGAALHTAGLGIGDTALVMGLGGIGLSVVQGARVAGAGIIIASDPVASRREAAARFGATHVLDPTTDDVFALAMDLTGGIGVDVAFDAVGHTALVTTGLGATRIGGTTVMVGVPPLDQPLVIDLPAVFAANAKRLVGCLLGGVNSLRDIPRLIALWQAGQLDLEGLITGHRPLADINAAFDDLRAGRGIRTVIDL
jgi:S-(hydroxymethyl)glutathione dehydrogenase / alcohol dehydrogenase